MFFALDLNYYLHWKLFGNKSPVVYAKLGSAYARLGLALDPHDTAGATKE